MEPPRDSRTGEEGPELLPLFITAYPFQPATAFWRAIELRQVIGRCSLPTGLGLDLGCGDGKLTSILLQFIGPRNLIGLDLDKSETALAARSGAYSEIVAASSAGLPFSPESLDFVYSNSVLEHIEAIAQTLDEVARVLKSSGEFLFTVPAAGFHTCLRGPWLPWVSREEYLKAVDARTAHLRYWSEDRWREELSKRGLLVERTHHWLTKWQVRRWELLSRITGGLLFNLFGKKRHPIEIQRMLGMREQRKGLPRPLAEWFARFIQLRTSEDEAGTAGLLIEARKK